MGSRDLGAIAERGAEAGRGRAGAIHRDQNRAAPARGVTRLRVTAAEQHPVEDGESRDVARPRADHRDRLRRLGALLDIEGRGSAAQDQERFDGGVEESLESTRAVHYAERRTTGIGLESVEAPDQGQAAT